MFRFIPPQH